MYFKNTCCDQIIDNDAKHFFSVMYMQSTPNPYASIYFYWSHISSHISQKSHFKRGFTKVVVTRADPSREWSQRELRLYMKFIYSSFQGRFFITVLFSIHFCSTRFLTVFTLKTELNSLSSRSRMILNMRNFSSLKTSRCSEELHIYTTSFCNYIIFVKKKSQSNKQKQKTRLKKITRKKKLKVTCFNYTDLYTDHLAKRLSLQ